MSQFSPDAILPRWLNSSPFDGGDALPIESDGPITASASSAGPATIREDPTFATYAGMWLGWPLAEQTDTNVAFEASGLGDVYINAGTFAPPTFSRFINLEFDGGVGLADSFLRVERTAPPGNVIQCVFFGGAATVPQQTLNNILATIAAVADANAKSALTAILNALVNYNLVVAT